MENESKYNNGYGGEDFLVVNTTHRVQLAGPIEKYCNLLCPC